jgi:hypothetical protein
MVSPISAISSSTPGVRALARVSAVTPRPEPVEAPAAPAAAPAEPSPPPGPGARDALPAGYRNLNLPVAAAEARAQMVASAARGDAMLAAAYGPNAAALAALPRLVGDRLPVRTIAREAETAARARAEAHGETLSAFLDSAPIVADARRPSRNGADAEATLRLSLLARDGAHETATLDVYLAKTGPGAFEAVAYDRDFAAPAGGFPYGAAPLSVDRLLFDPVAQAIVAAAVGAPRALAVPAADDARRPSFGIWIFASGVATATLLGAALALAADRPVAALAAACLGTGSVSLILRRRS